MRRAICLVLLAGLSLNHLGCVAVVGNKGPFSTCDKQAVVMNDEIYVVDLGDISVQKIDPEIIMRAETITQIEVESADD